MAIVIDSSVLSAFAKAEQLDSLERLTAGSRRSVTRAVLEEIDIGVAIHPRLANVRSCTWLEHVTTDGLQELRVFSEYIQLLGSSGRDIGEAATLAWAETHGGVALIDDDAAARAGRARSCVVRRSLWLVADGVNRAVLTREGACRLVDDLVRLGDARFPCDGQSFLGWAEDKGLVTP
ncbi:MAG TPA: hypothetical protein VGM88_29375 [Kofleriaceae bacterium]|jgi:hypothetical protein